MVPFNKFLHTFLFLVLFLFCSCENQYPNETYKICSKACGHTSPLVINRSILECLATCETDVVNLLMMKLYDIPSGGPRRKTVNKKRGVKKALKSGFNKLKKGVGS